MSLRDRLFSIGYSVGATIKKHLPEIMIGAGVTAFVGATVIAVKETPKAMEAKKEYDEARNVIDTAKTEGKTADGKDYTEEDAKKDISIAKGTFAGTVVKTYALSAFLTIVGGVCVCGADAIQLRRIKNLEIKYTELAKDYAVLASTFSAYRRKVAELHGEEEDVEIAQDAYEEAVSEVGEPSGKYLSAEVAVNNDDFYRLFDEGNFMWTKAPGMCYLKLKSKQDYWEMKRKLGQTVEFNDVLKDIGYPETKVGHMVCWHDKPVDFGIDAATPAAKAFREGYERNFLLHFTCTENTLDYLGDDVRADEAMTYVNSNGITIVDF